MTVEMQHWIVERSGGIRSMQTAWTRAVAIAESSGWAAEAILRVGHDLSHPTSLTKLCESAALEGHDKDESVLDAIEKRADESAYSAGDWIQAMEMLLQFLIREGRSAKLEVQLGYLACSGEYLSSSGSPLSFAQGVSEFLAEFGFDG